MKLEEVMQGAPAIVTKLRLWRDGAPLHVEITEIRCAPPPQTYGLPSHLNIKLQVVPPWWKPWAKRSYIRIEVEAKHGFQLVSPNLDGVPVTPSTYKPQPQEDPDDADDEP